MPLTELITRAESAILTGMRRKPHHLRDEYVTIAQAAEIRGVSRRWIAALVARGELPFEELGPRAKLIRRSDLAALALKRPGRPRKRTM